MKKFYSLVISLVLLASLGMAQINNPTDWPQCRNSSGSSQPEQPTSVFLGDNATFGCDSWATCNGNWPRWKVVINTSDQLTTGGIEGEYTSYLNTEHKTTISPRFTSIGTWFWGMKVDYGGNPVSWYCRNDASWHDMWAEPTSNLTITVNSLNTPSSQTATRNATNPTTAIDLSWVKDAQNHNVMIVRKKKFGESWTEPTQGTPYAVEASIGSGVVVYNGSGTSFTDSGLNPGTGYEYKFYSENFSYYSPGVTTAAVYTAMETYTVGGGGAYCTGGTGVNITLSGSDLGVSYQLLKGIVAAGAPILGTGNALTFSNITEAGSYTIEATQNPETLLMTGSVDVSVNPVPESVSVSGGGVYCSSTTLNATGGVGGTIYFQGVTSNGTSTANSNTSVVVSTSNIYYFRSVSSEGCWGEQGVAVVDIDFATPPAAGAITGSNTVNQGQSTVSYSIEALQYATSYIWSYSGAGATITGTGNNVTISFSNSATSGDLTVSGHNSCGDGLVSAGYTITVSPASNPPTTFNVTGTGSYCATGAGLAVGLDGSESGVTYTLYKGLEAQTPTVAGTGGAISFGAQLAGTYTVSGTSSGGTTPMEGSAIITAVAAPTASAGTSQFVTIGIPYTINGATASNYTTISWAKTGGSGNGTFDPVDQLVTVFSGTTAGPMDITLTASNAFCPAETSTVTYYIIGVDPVQWVGGTSDWHLATNWFPQIVPNSNISATIPLTGIANFPVVSSAASCKNLTLESGASILDNGNLTVSGTTTINRAIPTSTDGEWHFISSPVSNATAAMFTGMYLQRFIENTYKYEDVELTGDPLTVMKGFALWTGPAVYNASFTGPFNTGDKSITVTRNDALSDPKWPGWNLVGNPYPSYIDWNSSGLEKQDVNNTIYIHIDNTTWATYNGSTNTNGGSRYIAPCQGFFVESKFASGTLSISNSARTNNTAAFFKNTKDDVVNNLIRLEVSGNGYKDEAVIVFDSEATTNFDGQFDAHKLYGDAIDAAQIYSMGGKELAINYLPETDVIPVGVKVGTSGTFTIAATEINDLQYVTLEDTKTGIFTELSKGAYTFDYSSGENELRFKLHFSALSVDETKTKAAHIYSYQKTVYVNVAEQTEGDIYIYNIAGQLVASKPSARGMNEIGVQVTGNYIVKVITKGSTVVEKVFVQ